MAKSPAHKLGQIIGDHVETAIGVPLRDMATEFDLYLDHQQLSQLLAVAIPQIVCRPPA